MFTGKERGAFTSKLSKVKETRNCSLLLKYWSFILATNSGSTKIPPNYMGIFANATQKMPMTRYTYRRRNGA